MGPETGSAIISFIPLPVMQKIIRHLALPLFLCIVLISGCIEITEEVTVNPDGSGRFSLTADLGLIAATMNDENSGFDVSILDKLKETVVGAPDMLKEVKGIDSVVVAIDEKKGLYAFSFDFEGSKELNQALYCLGGVEKKAFAPKLIRISKHKLAQKDISPLLQKALGNSGKFNEMVYSVVFLNTIFHFPSDVKKAMNIRSKTPDSRTVTSRFTLQELMKGDFNAGHKVRF